MWIRMALFLFTPAVFTEPYYGPFDDTYNYQAEDIINSIQEGESPRGRRFESAINTAANSTMAPEDAEAIKDAINQFLDRNQPDYVAPTNPTRTPKPDQSPKRVFTNITRTQKSGPNIQEYITKPTRTPKSEEKLHEDIVPTTSIAPHSQEALERTATDPRRIAESQKLQKHMSVADPSRGLRPGAKMPGYIVRSRSQGGEPSGQVPPWIYPLTPGSDSASRTRPRHGYTQLPGLRMDYTNLFDAKKMPLRTQIALAQTIPSRTISGKYQYRTATRSSKSQEYFMPRASVEPEPVGNPLRFGGTRKRTRRTRTTTTTTTTTTRTTRNTLCTHGPNHCKTMCFDEDKYRVSCAPTPPRVDMIKLFSMMDILLQDYDTNNLTERYNKSVRHNYGTCWHSKSPTTTTTTTTTTTEPPVLYYDYDESSNKTGTIIAKCFVCGLEAEGIPEDAHCSDAFAGEFLPLTPVDASARGHLADYRKYCKYMDMLQWYINGTESRSIWGAWTGGCAVRWLDLSGVYTQRACRNRLHPATGRHYVSKRMARLELALGAVDNGCLISPMASLVPFSRGVSLYARFHACVCTGSWCNRAMKPRWGSLVIAPLVFAILL